MTVHNRISNWDATWMTTADIILDVQRGPSFFTMEDILKKLKALDNADVVVKCDHCGQWGAVKTACKYCGAAVG